MLKESAGAALGVASMRASNVTRLEHEFQDSPKISTREDRERIGEWLGFVLDSNATPFCSSGSADVSYVDSWLESHRETDLSRLFDCLSKYYGLGHPRFSFSNAPAPFSNLNQVEARMKISKDLVKGEGSEFVEFKNIVVDANVKLANKLARESMARSVFSSLHDSGCISHTRETIYFENLVRERLGMEQDADSQVFSPMFFRILNHEQVQGFLEYKVVRDKKTDLDMGEFRVELPTKIFRDDSLFDEIRDIPRKGRYAVFKHSVPVIMMNEKDTLYLYRVKVLSGLTDEWIKIARDYDWLEKREEVLKKKMNIGPFCQPKDSGLYSVMIRKRKELFHGFMEIKADIRKSTLLNTARLSFTFPRTSIFEREVARHILDVFVAHDDPSQISPLAHRVFAVRVFEKYGNWWDYVSAERFMKEHEQKARASKGPRLVKSDGPHVDEHTENRVTAGSVRKTESKSSRSNPTQSNWQGRTLEKASNVSNQRNRRQPRGT
jgi:hypothetical protein